MSWIKFSDEKPSDQSQSLLDKAQDDDIAEHDSLVQERPSRWSTIYWTSAVLALSLVVSLLISPLWAILFPGIANKARGTVVGHDHVAHIQPARAHLSYVVDQPSPDAWKHSIYSYEPTKESDVAWSKLQTVRGVSINQDERHHLNATGLRAGESETATVLGVMHNIHCLRIIRQMLYPDYYYPGRSDADHKKQLVHVGHCIEAIRQSVMCTPDLTPMGAFWENDEHDAIAINPSSQRQCVVWDSLVAWEKPREYGLKELWQANPEGEGTEEADDGPAYR